MERQAIILAAGKGTRMHSKVPKVLHTLAGKPLIQHVLETAFAFGVSDCVVVVGHGSEQVREAISTEAISFVTQEMQLGTGHAVLQALLKIKKGAKILLLYGDVPLVSVAALQQFEASVGHADLGVLSVTIPNPAGYGRIVKNCQGKVQAIVEEKDATSDQKLINEVNSGIYLVKAELLIELLPKLKNDNAQGEYLLTDLIALAVDAGAEVCSYSLDDPMLVAGVNDRFQLAEVERYYQRRLARVFLEAGLALRDPERFDLRGELSFGTDVVIDVNVVLEGQIRLGDGVFIGANCVLKNVTVQAGTRIEPFSHLEDAQIGPDATVGPFARLRPGTVLNEGVKIGNFVEIKKASVGAFSKVNHLAYVGDATIGKAVNIGAGTIFCNYDGVHKYHTNIDNDVFIGSNCALVAPLEIGSGATVGAGSTITQTVPPNKLTLGRARQTTHPTWERPKSSKG